MDFSRRDFMKFFGKGAILSSLPLSWFSCSRSVVVQRHSFFQELAKFTPQKKDAFLLAHGFQHSILCKEGDVINRKLQDKFGSDNDFIGFIPINKTGTKAFLFVNHEQVSPTLLHGEENPYAKTPEMIDLEQYHCGGSILKVYRSKKTGLWKIDYSSPYNKRVTGKTPIPFTHQHSKYLKGEALGMVGNCGGGITPWKTFLTCEENYHKFYGDIKFKSNAGIESDFGWERFHEAFPTHYGWVVEVDPWKGTAKKLVSLGRFAHESATVAKSRDGRAVVYMGDDHKDRCFYKFVAAKKGSLEEGELFVADFEKGRWISLDINKSKKLQEHFKDQIEVLVYARLAAEIVGGTPLDRPEDVEIHPQTGEIYLSLTSDKDKGNWFGSVIKIQEMNGNYLSDRFISRTFKFGGKESGFACPDNMAFDRNGNLWVCSDIPGSYMNKPPYTPFKNNGLYFIPTQGKLAGKVFQLASAPTDAECTGICFSKDYRTLFLSVQHPGGESVSRKKLTSHWPLGGKSLPKSSVVQVYGESLDKLMNINWSEVS